MNKRRERVNELKNSRLRLKQRQRSMETNQKLCYVRCWLTMMEIFFSFFISENAIQNINPFSTRVRIRDQRTALDYSDGDYLFLRTQSNAILIHFHTASEFAIIKHTSDDGLGVFTLYKLRLFTKCQLEEEGGVGGWSWG